MKTLLIFAAGAVLAGSALAQGTINAPVIARHALPPVNPAIQAEGGLQRGFRLGNPLQMINPFASRDYGSGRDFVVTRNDEQGLRPRDKPRGAPVALRLFSIAF